MRPFNFETFAQLDKCLRYLKEKNFNKKILGLEIHNKSVNQGNLIPPKQLATESVNIFMIKILALSHLQHRIFLSKSIL